MQVREQNAPGPGADDLADPPLPRAGAEQPASVQHEHAPLQHVEVAPDENRVRLAGEERAEEPLFSDVTRRSSGRGSRGLRATPARTRMPLHSSSRRSAQTGSSWRQTTSGPSTVTSRTISSRYARRLGGEVFPWNTFQLRTSTRLLYGPPMRRFEDLIERQIAIFCEDYADLMSRAARRPSAPTTAPGAEEAEERYAAFLELVEEGSEALGEIRETYASTLEPDQAEPTSGRSTRRSRAGCPRSGWVSRSPGMGRSAHCGSREGVRSCCRVPGPTSVRDRLDDRARDAAPPLDLVGVLGLPRLRVKNKHCGCGKFRWQLWV